jgi:hypothetical protein
MNEKYGGLKVSVYFSCFSCFFCFFLCLFFLTFTIFHIHTCALPPPSTSSNVSHRSASGCSEIGDWDAENGGVLADVAAVSCAIFRESIRSTSHILMGSPVTEQRIVGWKSIP